MFDHDNMKYLKKLLDELDSVMDQVETELQRRVEETPGSHYSLSLSNHCTINRHMVLERRLFLVGDSF